MNHVNRLLGDRVLDGITWEDVQRLVDTLEAENRARESIRKCRTALAMVIDYAGVAPNPARDRRIKLPLEEPEEVSPPHADHVEAAAWLLSSRYLLALVTLDATGARVGELHAATIGDLDESRQAWLVRAKVAKDAACALGAAPRRPLCADRRPATGEGRSRSQCSAHRLRDN